MSSSKVFHKIILGTAQFGLSYGIANTAGQVSRAETASILSLAKQRGINTLDTAIAYGESEKVLGDIGIPDWQIISKLPALPDTVVDVATWVDTQVAGSLQRLRTNRLHALLLHRPSQLLESRGGELYRALVVQKERGAVEKIGISIYDASELDQLMSHMRFDVVQAPFNVLDARMIDSGWMERLEKMGCELHVRSVFLQGLLLMSLNHRPTQFDRWQPLWAIWDAWLHDSGLTPIQACLRHALSTPGIAKVVLGIDTTMQLEQILVASRGDLPPIPDALKIGDPELLNPALWKKT
jgi:aryl-alcohol dehydrogenase-like predicted oxidoreductase